MPDPITQPPSNTPAPVNPSLFAQPGEDFPTYEARVAGANGGAAPGTPPGSNPQDTVAKSLGYDSYNDAVSKLTAPPTKSETDLYNSAFSAAGLDALHATITGKQNDLASAQNKINDDPWLDEADRVGRNRTVQDLATADIKNYQDEYDEKVKEVNDLVTRETADGTATTAANKAKLAALESQAKELATQTATQQKTADTPPKTIKGPSGATYQWNPATKKFDPILPGKTPAPATKTFAFTPKQTTALESEGLDSNSANGILQDIQSGQPLESIRQQMKASNLDPGLLDKVMLYVDPAHNTPAKK